MHKKPICKGTLLTSSWNQFISTVNIKDKLHFQSIPVILFQNVASDNTEDLFYCRVEVKLKIIIPVDIDSNSWWQSENQSCLVIFSSIQLSVYWSLVIDKLIILFCRDFCLIALVSSAGKLNKNNFYTKNKSHCTASYRYYY